MSEEYLTDLSGPSVFIGKHGDGIISLGSGQPDLPPPKEAISNLNVRCDLRYGLINGEISLRENLSKEYENSRPDDFVITNGASEALDLIFRAIENGKVLLGKPYYYSYPHLLKHSGMTPVYTELKEGKIDIDDFRKKVKDCKAVLINSPSNPTGRVENLETLKEIEKVTKDLGVYVISDEVYKDLIYIRDNYMIQGEHIITVNSFSKTYAMCGARVGYLWSNDSNFIKKIIDIKTHCSMNTSLIAQDMAMHALDSTKDYIKQQLKIWRERRDYVYERLKNMGLDVWKPEGAFYVFPKVANPKKFVLDMYNKHKIIVYLGEWFGDPQRVRISYATGMDDLKKTMDIIENYLKKN